MLSDAAIGVGIEVIGLSKVRTRRGGGGEVEESPPPLPRYADHGEYGFYEGDLSPSSSSSSSSSNRSPPQSTPTAASKNNAASSSGDDATTKMVRSGYGRMHYDSGNYYEGGFQNDSYHGIDCLYVWIDGDDEKVSWNRGKRHGISVYRSHDENWGSIVEYRRYENGMPVGEGIRWSEGGTIAHRTTNDGNDGGKEKGKEGTTSMMPMSHEEAEAYSMEKFGLNSPDPSSFLPPNPARVVSVSDGTSHASTTTSSSVSKTGFLARLFSRRMVGSDGKLMFKDNGTWGAYDGNVNEKGDRLGMGRMTYVDGSNYEGTFVDDKYHCDMGAYRWSDGDEYKGSFKDGERHGVGLFTSASDGTSVYSMYDNGYAVGAGVGFEKDCTKAYGTLNGVRTVDMTIEDAERIVSEKFSSLPSSLSSSSFGTAPSAAGVVVPTESNAIPEAVAFTPPPPPANTKRTGGLGLFANFFSNRKIGPNGEPMFKDHGDWGTYAGEIDGDGNRIGSGKMTYADGGTYEGTFVNDKYHGDMGVYRWSDGDEYSGGWKDGERHGIGTFRFADGSVEYFSCEAGVAKGEGVNWSPDRKVAYRTLDGTKTIEMSIDEAEKFAREKFDLPVPEPSATTVVDGATAASALSKIGLFERLFSNRKVGPDGKQMFKDHGDWGSYEGDVDDDGNRSGSGKMTYSSGGYYEGGFLDNKFHGDKCLYRWADGEEYEGSWKDGDRHGTGIFRSTDGTVIYSTYDMGAAIGEGLCWSADHKTVHKTVDGTNKMLILPEEAEEYAREKFGLPVPDPREPTSNLAAAEPTSKKTGLLGSLFLKKKVDLDGKPMFKDYGEWGSYEGVMDGNGNRHGRGKMTYASGSYYEGCFLNDKFHGNKGVYHWLDGDEYEGGWKDGERHGVAIFRSADGTVEYSMCEAGVMKGEGVRWSADRKEAHKTLDGENKMLILCDEAAKFAKDKFGLPVPEPSTTISSKVAARPMSSKIGLFGMLFSKHKVDSDGKPMFKDYDDWGSYEGAMDESGNRHGRGKMTYASGSYYEGYFINDKFHGDKGVYHWLDGDEYEGGWKNGERHGVGIFRSADGTVEYSTYEMGVTKGEGVAWSVDRKTAHKTKGKEKNEISLGLAEKLAKELFDLPVPEPCAKVSTPAEATVKPSLFRRLFSTRSVGQDGKLMFRDNGEWGSYKGGVDENGNRQGSGKMTYVSGSYYEGRFLNDKFHGDKGVYHWLDGDEYEGGWKNGEQHGVGIFRSADGTVGYSMYDAGMPRGEGVSWCADRKKSHRTLDGKKAVEILLEEAETLAKDKFGLPVPKPSSTVLVQAAAQPTSSKTGFFVRLFSNRKVGPDGKRMFKDYGEWGSYEGGVDENGNRQGSGKMTYVSGSYYEGRFLNDKFHGDKGVYHWLDGDEYEGGWKDGERHGVGIFRSADGTVEYSTYEMGVTKGDGLYWSSDRKIICKTLGLEKGAEISVSMAEKLAKDMFGLPAPARASLDGELRFVDYGDVGTYEGDNVNGLRQGEGKMLYDSGNTYEGDFYNGKFDGNIGSFRWADGTQYEGSWKDGLFNGVGVFRIPDVGVDYSIYKNGYATGVGVFWNVDYTKAFHTLDGVKMTEISLADAQKLAKAKFGLPTPKRGALQSVGEKMQQKKIGADGKPMFNDYGLWGSYEGDIDVSGERVGNGKMTYADGGYYEGGFVDDKFYCDKGTYHWFDGDEYEGGWKEGERHGVGIFRKADGIVEYSMYEMGEAKGEGVMWSPDRKTTNRTVSGVKKDDISNGMAEKLAKELFDLPVPEPFATATTNAAAAPVSSKIGLFERLFSNRKVGPDGKQMFKDHGDWGTYEGDVDDGGIRQGMGKMIYVSGGYYEGDFVDDKFHGDKGIYRWADGEEYEGSWKDGDRHGVGIFRKIDGIVEISRYDAGVAKGEGVLWSADRKTAFKTVDGNKTMEMTIEEALALTKDNFGLSMPEPSTNVTAESTAKPYLEPSTPVPTTTPVPTHAAAKQKTGFFASFFSSRKVGLDGKPMFKDHGTWGTYEGDVDDEGNRMGKGKMTYDDGSYYDGGFVNDKFHGDSGVYHWFDGDEYKGSFKDGERHGVGIFRTTDGVMIYSIYDAGAAKGSGVGFSVSRETAFETVDGIKTKEILIEDAELLVKEKFDLPTPEPSSTVSSLATTDPSVLS